MSERRAALIFNPQSGRSSRRLERVRRMCELLAAKGISIDVRGTAAPGDAVTLSRKAVTEGKDMVIVYGGDGTVNEAVQGMAGSRVPLAVWSGGTANVVARDLGLPSRIEALSNVIAAGKERRISLGITRSSDGSARYFVMFAGIGLDASICRAVNQKLKRKVGELAFWAAGIKHLFAWEPSPFRIEIEDVKYEAAFALIGNGKGYGGGIVMTPGARLDEPSFEVFILPKHRRNASYLMDLILCKSGRPERSRGILLRGDRITASSAGEIWVEVDGEVFATLPMTIEAAPDALSLIVP
ncbi:MAG: hypothetical protein DMF61_23345 [Blastocatellia bacterium AA13]|nr:MAG: hypothetical protein DMF61_23345 [Blastocatellia bacterium AA13]